MLQPVLRTLVSVAGLLWAPLGLAQGSGPIPARVDDIRTWDATLVVDVSGRFARTEVFEVMAIPDAPAEHSPHCATDRVVLKGIAIGQRSKANCIRVCAGIPSGYEFDATRAVTGSVSHAWSQFFNPEYFAKARNVCLHFKNWSDDTTARVRMFVPLCESGPNCLPPKEDIVPPRLETDTTPTMTKPGRRDPTQPLPGRNKPPPA